MTELRCDCPTYDEVLGLFTATIARAEAAERQLAEAQAENARLREAAEAAREYVDAIADQRGRGGVEAQRSQRAWDGLVAAVLGLHLRAAVRAWSDHTPQET